ncbi:MAG: anthranilate phosphoribosyltransferase [Ilumatobacteraceae bacterium]|nr:anthranilate phosphoribosyltransferase [Ilumatobacteraceae bacterium]
MTTNFRGWTALITDALAGRDLDESDAAAAMATILDGDATPAQIAGFLVAMKSKGVVATELVGMLDAALAASPVVPLSDDERSRAIDVVGTGGDGSHSINVSTMAALVAAGAGVPICKHGNRSASSKCGTADVLETLGLNIELRPEQVAASVREAGFGFCFAPAFHPAFRHAGPPRRELGIPTAFNLIGPMANPGRVQRQVIGVADPGVARSMLEALAERGLRSAWIVHGSGLDEITTTGPTEVLSLHAGTITAFTIEPAALGIPLVTADQLRGGDREENAEVVRRVLGGEHGPHRDVVVLNAAAALVVAGVAEDLPEAMTSAAAAIDDGRALHTLDAAVRVSHRA